MARAVVLLSGGLDSTVSAAIARDEGHELYALSFDYGQRHKRELESASRVAKALRARDHKVFSLNLAQFGGSALTDESIGVPTGREESQMGADIPVTYVPARNTVFLSVALAYAEVQEAQFIYIGANALDYSGYPDCRPEYFAAFERMANLATKRGVEGHPIHLKTPLLHMTKADIVRAGLRHKAPLELTWSCYQGGAVACGACDSCLLRLKGFKEAGVTDPVPYATN
ncbi:MAG TPA: 7-cyano-7-deazaguanine synthase QueC [Candidatus Thermoplasmatota archaeon]|nr:7-cyano-7-deazaguanine synthase QueC [Candidatus Thermoplasmatota archaeon]